jgi:hypothetical protein
MGTATLRHTVATLMLNRGADVRYVGELLGRQRSRRQQSTPASRSPSSAKATAASTCPEHEDPTCQESDPLRGHRGEPGARLRACQAPQPSS